MRWLSNGVAVSAERGVKMDLVAYTPSTPNVERRDGSGRRTIIRDARRLASNPHLLACADQGIVSAASFLTLVMLARWTDAGQVGIFALGVSVLGVMTAILQSLVAQPYAILRHRPADESREHAFGALLQCGMLAAAGMLIVMAAALIIAATGARTHATMAWALAGLIPLVMAREFARDFVFAHMRLANALALDIAVTLLQFVILAALAVNGAMSALGAFGAMAVASGIPVLVWLYLNRSEFMGHGSQVRAILKENWLLGKWLALSKIALLIQGYSVQWLSIVIAGAATAGVFAASISIVSFANPLLFGLYNLLIPRSVLALKAGGGAALRAQAVRDALLIGALMGSFTLLVFIAGEWVIALLYPGPDYEGQGLTVTVLSLATMVAAMGVPASNAVASMERPRPMVAVTAAAAMLNFLLVWWLMLSWGLAGAACGVLMANIAGSAGRWIVFEMLLRRGENDR